VNVLVEDPNVVFSGSKTICYSRGGNYDGCPSGALHKQISRFEDIRSDIATGRRLLLRRGDTFTQSAEVGLNVAGPVLIGAYGSSTAAKPLIEASGTALGLSSGRGPRLEGVRIVDLRFRGPGRGDGATAYGFFRDLLMLRTEFENYNTAFMSPES